MLKRTSSWVRRYAFIDGPARMLHYKNTKSDMGWKYSIDLSMAKVNKGLRNGMQPFLFIEPDAKESETIEPVSQYSSGKKSSQSFIVANQGKVPAQKRNSVLFSSKKKG